MISSASSNDPIRISYKGFSIKNSNFECQTCHCLQSNLFLTPKSFLSNIQHRHLWKKQLIQILNVIHFKSYPFWSIPVPITSNKTHWLCEMFNKKKRNKFKKKKKVGVVENKGWLMHMLKKTRVNFNFSSWRIYVVSLIFKIKMSH